MKQLNLKTEIQLCPSFGEFLDYFEFDQRDCIFTMHIFKDYFKELKNLVHFIFYDDYSQGEPDDEAVERIIEDMKGYGFRRIFAVGGGSVIDAAKILVLKDIKKVSDIYLTDMPLKKDKRLIVIPTTCGTGSEVTNIAVMKLVQRNMKRGRNDDAFFPDETVLIPEMIENLPMNIMMACSIDALAHASESLISPKATAYTRIFAREAMEKILLSYKALNENQKDRTILEQLLVGSNMAGISMSYAGTGIVHALAMGASGLSMHLSHGEAVYLFLMESMKFYNKKKPQGAIREFKEIIGAVFGCGESYALEYLESVLEEFLEVKRLEPLAEKALYDYADNLLLNQQRLYVNSYVKPTREEIVEILKGCCKKEVLKNV